MIDQEIKDIEEYLGCKVIEVREDADGSLSYVISKDYDVDKVHALCEMDRDDSICSKYANENSDLSEPHFVREEDKDKLLCFATRLTDEEWDELN